MPIIVPLPFRARLPNVVFCSIHMGLEILAILNISWGLILFPLAGICFRLTFPFLCPGQIHGCPCFPFRCPWSCTQAPVEWSPSVVINIPPLTGCPGPSPGPAKFPLNQLLVCVFHIHVLSNMSFCDRSRGLPWSSGDTSGPPQC